MKKLDLQLFAQDGVITTAQIEAEARAIDFVSSFSSDIRALQEILQITRSIEKPNGSKLVAYRASGQLKSGAVAEGELIPFSQYTVNEVDLGSLTLSKYAKAVTIEAVEKYGYAVAVMRTDEEFKGQLRAKVVGDLYAYLQQGTLTGTATGLQAAMAQALGKAQYALQIMGKEASGYVAFINTLDLFDYLGDQVITMQTAFGQSYLENFLGADIVFVTANVPQGKVIATAINNMIMYHINPGNSEYAQMGLSYVVDSTLPVLGFATEGNYSRAQGETYALMGISIYAEYLDAISVITLSGAGTLKSLTVTSTAGTKDGTTKITVSPALTAGNQYKYQLATEATPVALNQNVRNWTPWDGSADIPVAEGQTITVAECNSSYQAKGAGSATVTLKAGE